MGFSAFNIGSLNLFIDTKDSVTRTEPLLKTCKRTIALNNAPYIDTGRQGLKAPEYWAVHLKARAQGQVP
jgi:hypothetical protein